MDFFEATVSMEGGHPWGLRIDGGAECNQPIRISKVICGSKAFGHGIEVGDIVTILNGQDSTQMTSSRARHLIRSAEDHLILKLKRLNKPGCTLPVGWKLNSSSVTACKKLSGGADKTNIYDKTLSDDEMSGGSTSDSQGSIVNADVRNDRKGSAHSTSSTSGPPGSMLAHGTSSHSSNVAKTEACGAGTSLVPGRSLFDRIFKSSPRKQAKQNAAVETSPIESRDWWNDRKTDRANSRSEPLHTTYGQQQRVVDASKTPRNPSETTLQPAPTVNLSMLDEVLQENRNLKLSKKEKTRPVSATKPPIGYGTKPSGTISPLPVSPTNNSRNIFGILKTTPVKPKTWSFPYNFGLWDRRKPAQPQTQQQVQQQIPNNTRYDNLTKRCSSAHPTLAETSGPPSTAVVNDRTTSIRNDTGGYDFIGNNVGTLTRNKMESPVLDRNDNGTLTRNKPGGYLSNGNNEGTLTRNKTEGYTFNGNDRGTLTRNKTSGYSSDVNERNSAMTIRTGGYSADGNSGTLTKNRTDGYFPDRKDVSILPRNSTAGYISVGNDGGTLTRNKTGVYNSSGRDVGARTSGYSSDVNERDSVMRSNAEGYLSDGSVMGTRARNVHLTNRPSSVATVTPVVSVNQPTNFQRERQQLVPFQNLSSKTTRQQWDEENRQRKMDIEKVIAGERHRKFLREQQEMEARRHNDCCSPVEKSLLLSNRFNEDGLPSVNLEHPQRKTATKIRGKARALYNFRAQNNRELSLRKGDTVYLLCRVDKNWFEGERNGMVGIFPVNYVEIVQSLQEARAVAKLREGMATVLYNFTAQSSIELSLKKGYTVALIRRVDENWYEGRIGNSQGIFPASYVEAMREPDTPLPTPMHSQASTPVPGATPGKLSPASSVVSYAPEIPSAPMSRRNSDFYESEMEMDALIDALQTGRDFRSSRPSSVVSEPAFQRAGSITPRPQQLTARPNPLATRPQPVLRMDAPTNISQKPPMLCNRSNNTSNTDIWGKPGGNTESSRSINYTFEMPSPEDRRNSLGKPTSSAVEIKEKVNLEPTPVISNSRKPVSYPRYRALYNFKPKNADELELCPGDVVRVVEKCKDGWFVGFMETSKQFGTFPGNFVQQVLP